MIYVTMYIHNALESLFILLILSLYAKSWYVYCVIFYIVRCFLVILKKLRRNRNYFNSVPVQEVIR